MGAGPRQGPAEGRIPDQSPGGGQLLQCRLIQKEAVGDGIALVAFPARRPIATGFVVQLLEMSCLQGFPLLQPSRRKVALSSALTEKAINPPHSAIPEPDHAGRMQAGG